MSNQETRTNDGFPLASSMGRFLHSSYRASEKAAASVRPPMPEPKPPRKRGS